MPDGGTNGSILLIDGSGALRGEVASYLEKRRFSVVRVESASAGLDQFRLCRPFLVFLDYDMPQDDIHDVLSSLAKEAPDTPVIIVTPSPEVPAAVNSLVLDAYDVLPQPVRLSALEHAVRHAQFHATLLNAIRHHQRYLERRNVELDVRLRELEDLGDKLRRQVMSRAASEQDRKITERQLNVVERAIDNADDALLITDPSGVPVYMNPAFMNTFGSQAAKEGEPFELARVFKTGESSTTMTKNLDTLGRFTCEVPMVSVDGREFPALVRASSIVDNDSTNLGRLYIFSDITEQEQLRKEAYHDALTGLYSRRHFEDQARRHLSLARRHGNPLSLCLCDLDMFKEINDTYGHRAGDDVLKAFGETIVGAIRAEDVAGRLGGDEFCICFPYAEALVAATCLERIRHRLRTIEFRTDDGQTFTVTATFGIADIPSSEASVEELMELADKSLYKAKELGRNCTVANMALVS